MDQARSTISKIFNGEPRSYTRFNLTQNMEGENSHVEMKLSSDVDEELGPSGGEHLNQNQNHMRQSYLRHSKRSPKNVCFMVIATLLIFVIGYLIGYLAHHKQDKDAAICAPAFAGSDDNEEPVQEEFEPTLDWEDLKTLLKNKLIPDRFEASFRSYGLESHEAGTAADEKMASLVYSSFKDYRMNPWHDEHYVKLQSLSPSSPNTIKFNGEVIGTPRGYAAYSATGTAEGRLLYAHYGMDSDFRSLQDRGIDLTGSVVLVRAGKLSFAEKVANAAKQNVVAVLIYPDPANYALRGDTELYGHVHLGSGDPYTPGFPSFNHTQFPPAQSSGLPSILAQTISANTAAKLFDKMSGQNAPSTWEEGGLQGVIYKLGDINDNVTVEVNNVLMEKKITNVFGVIKGFVDPDRYVVIGAQRDSWGPGFAKATVGTTLLMELACALSEMVKNDGFKPRRSIIFASWSAGEYGSVGTTEWLEGYLTSLNLKAFSYISLDGTIRGDQKFLVSSSPLLYSLVISTMKEVENPDGSNQGTLYSSVARANFDTEVFMPMRTDDASYPFLAFSGIPSISFCFAGNRGPDYQYFGTLEDTRQKLEYIMSTRTTQFAMAAAQVAGHMALRLVHDHLLRLDVSKYNSKIRSYVSQINRLVSQQSSSSLKNLNMQWLMSAYGSFSRASSDLLDNIQNSDLTDVEMCRNINDRIMRVEHNLLSPYVSPKDIPFRHIIFGSGSHTLSDLVDHLNAMRNNMPNASVDRFRNQFALATWTIQGCSNALSGEIWEKDNQI
ncbi:transferrin receptor protein 1-like [Scleropages formosus]|uniref:Transferrin receptor protein 1 n=1 Tax=Scleropages formosus TaxID=113540 RepID=A0A8C9RHH4_SCLFO|nr:transferrin receptor protein 1 [Scleropages formosus]XP_018609265.1 transferrin receptor protein 1 [Scleropages formosus]